MSRDPVLPSWAKQIESSAVEAGKLAAVIEVDPSKAYPLWFERLSSTAYGVLEGMSRMPAPDALDQYWLEVAYQCTKLELQSSLAGSSLDLRSGGAPVEFRFKNCPEYALVNHPQGRGVAQATAGREAREHYRRIMGALP